MLYVYLLKSPKGLCNRLPNIRVPSCVVTGLDPAFPGVEVPAELGGAFVYILTG